MNRRRPMIRPPLDHINLGWLGYDHGTPLLSSA
jgi:hypothetical protein